MPWEEQSSTAAAEKETVVKPDLYVKYSHFRKMLQAEEAGGAADGGTSELVMGVNSTGDVVTSNTVAALVSLDPCREQNFISGFQYSVGILQWPGANVGRWLDDTGDPRNPCTDQDFSDMLEAEGAFVALFSVRIADLSLLRLDLNGAAVIKLLESEELVTTSTIYSLESISVPRVTTSLDPSMTLESGVAAFIPVVVSATLKIPSLFGPAVFNLTYEIFDGQTCKDCESANEEVAEIMQNQTDFFRAAVDRMDAIDMRTPGAFNFTCINNQTCAWGLGFCASCFQVLIEIRAGVGAYNLDGFFEENQKGTNNVAPTDIESVVRQLPPECMTTCTTSFQIGFLGNDNMGQLLNSAAIMRTTNGFDWVRAFDDGKTLESSYFGIPGDLIDLVKQDTAYTGNLVDSSR